MAIRQGEALSPTQSGPIPTLIDNQPGNRMRDVLQRLMPISVQADIATGYFEVGALVDLDGYWQSLSKIRLVMGDEVTRKTKKVLVDSLSNSGLNGIENAKETDDWKALSGLNAISSALVAGKIEARVFTKAKFHAKAIRFFTGQHVDHGIIGSSNFTHPGLTQNVELNLHTADTSQLNELTAWFNKIWDEAEDIRADLLQIIEPHIREYFPFEVYLQAMRTRFAGLEPEETTWERTESRVYPSLAKYQRDAYYDLMHMAERWGGALLCDGVGLGKTFVGLMIIDRLLKERKRVLVIAPKAAIPSVWNRHLLHFFPDDFDPEPEYQHDIKVIPMTDFGMDDKITERRLSQMMDRYDAVLIDEAHHFRVPNRNRSLKLKRLVKDKMLFLLTATPINNSILDLYNLINYISQDRQNHFQSVNVPKLRAWFSQRDDEVEKEQLPLIGLEDATLQEFLKHVLVQRSRRYVKGLDVQEDEAVKFPVREKPEVIEYSLNEVYGPLLPKLLQAFDKKRAKLKLVIYETEKFKEEKQRDASALAEQSQVVVLIRTMLLKRLESSQAALEASVEDLLLKHVVLLQDLQPLKYELWMSTHQDIFIELQKHRQARFDTEDDEEEEELPVTNYERKKIEQVKADIKLFGSNETTWMEGLEADAHVLAALLRGLYEVSDPKNDAKLAAFIERIESTPRLMQDKFVVFSEFKTTARYLETQLKRRFPDAKIVEVDSGRNVKGRELVIQRFAPYYNCIDDEELKKALADPIRVLISTDVLSEGLNLQDANIIVNYDLHWNPVRLMQRIGRVDRRMDPRKPVDYDKVYVYNFLPPKELDEVLGLYSSLTKKIVSINRAIGIEAPILEANDDLKAMDFYLNLGEGTMSNTEMLRLIAHDLAKKHPELWEKTTEYPRRIYSGKASANFEPTRNSEANDMSGKGRYLFLCYDIVTGTEISDIDGKPPRDARWFMIDQETGEITEDLIAIHEKIQCPEGTSRNVLLDPAERTRLRKELEKKVVEPLAFRSQLPTDSKNELVCWMEV